ncbi:MAG: ZIP family metal transporter [Oligoflexia bacterium]|nr:ZIP family metal transporter [Oligoflexia bacterium]
MTLSPLAAAIIHSIVVLSAGLLPLTIRVQSKLFDLLLSFGAGALLSAAFLHMVPAAIVTIGPSVGFYILLGFLLMTFIEHFTVAHPCAEDHCHNHSHNLGLVAFFGLSIHSILSGLALGVALLESTSSDASMALLAAVIVHKIPETIAFVGLLTVSHWKKQKIYFILALFSLTGPLGILLGSSAFNGSEHLLSYALGVSSGTFIYIACSDLLPHLHKKMKQQWLHLVAFVLGILLLSIEAIEHIFG